MEMAKIIRLVKFIHFSRYTMKFWLRMDCLSALTYYSQFKGMLQLLLQKKNKKIKKEKSKFFDFMFRFQYSQFPSLGSSVNLKKLNVSLFHKLHSRILWMIFSVLISVIKREKRKKLQGLLGLQVQIKCGI